MNSNSAFGCSGATSVLYPGVSNCLRYKVTNPLKVTILVTSLSVSQVAFTPATTNTSLPSCSASDFTTTPFAPTNQSGYLSVPAGATVYLGEAVSLKDDGNQDNCQNGSFNFTVSGNAQYTEVYATTSALASSANPSPAGTTVTYTATVTASAASGQDPVPSSPTGTVAFKDGTTTISGCSAQPLTSSGVITSVATCAVTYSSTSGSPHSIAAVYTDGADGNFTGSTASALSETIQSGGNVTIGSGSTVTVSNGQAISGNVTVASGGTLNVNGGTVNGNVTVNGGKLIGTGGTISGNVTSSGSVSLTNTTVTGNLQTSAGPVTLGTGAVIGGNLLITGGGPINLNGVSLGSSGVGVGNNLQVSGVTAGPNTICATTTKGDLQWSSNSSPLTMGGSSGCPGNNVGGNLQVTSNAGNLTIGSASGFGNSASGNIQVQSNTGGGTLAHNTTTGGNCQLSGNTPGIVGTANSSAKQNKCNATS